MNDNSSFKLSTISTEGIYVSYSSNALFRLMAGGALAVNSEVDEPAPNSWPLGMLSPVCVFLENSRCHTLTHLEREAGLAEPGLAGGVLLRKLGNKERAEAIILGKTSFLGVADLVGLGN